MSAGSFVGLGDGRSIGFGRFEIEKYCLEEKEMSTKKKNRQGGDAKETTS